MKKQRCIYAALFLGLFLAELFIGLFVRDAFVRPYLGDVLVTVLLCAFCRIFIPQGSCLLPILVFLFAALVELAQHFQLIRWLGLAGNPFFETLMGTTFSHYDLICYAVGCLAFAVVERIIRKRSL